MSASRVGTDQLGRRNPGIDLVRGLSTLLVVIHHMSLRIPLAKTGLAGILPGSLLLTLGSSGYEAVFLFFVISGFLITGRAIRRWGALSALDAQAFYRRRLARIAPCLLVLLVVLSLLDLAGVSNYVITRQDQSLPRAIMSVLALRLNWYEGRTGYLPGGWDVLWSLSIEEVFYLGFPIACLCLGRVAWLRTVLFAALALSLPLTLKILSTAPEIWREKAYLPGMSAIAVGVCAALWAARRPLPRPAAVALLGWSGTLVLLVTLLQERIVWRMLGTATMLVLAGGCALMLVAFQCGWGQRDAARGTAWLRSFGLMSYEIYLTHMFVVFPLVALFRLTGGDMRAGWLWFIPALLLSWVLGQVVQRFLSLPVDRWLRVRLGASARTTRAAAT